MPTNQQIALMCDIAKSGGADLDRKGSADILALIADDYIKRIDDTVESYALTDRGQAVLDERGVGVNEG